MNNNFRKRCKSCGSETNHYNDKGQEFLCPNPTCNAEGQDAWLGVFVNELKRNDEVIRHNHTLNGD